MIYTENPFYDKAKILAFVSTLNYLILLSCHSTCKWLERGFHELFGMSNPVMVLVKNINTY
ncbi:hypothetical protein IFO69_18945 [Echinicola sp. CAU 1574]|uniref:Uncharacterized protein n=1 Tax=Echinicola arenosa TaxID=2774144 RepID=A0ABR9APY4_9BACT|nr:hypothetical protein [Echinicola arenosa]MBD8490837.1 hypothetical protein [Echinicola arenosa]